MSPAAAAQRAALLLLVTTAATGIALAVVYAERLFIDLDVYRSAGRMWLRGSPLYGPDAATMTSSGPLPFIYPPFAAVVFAPLAAMPWGLAVGVWTAAGLAAAGGTVWIVARRLQAGLAAGTAAGLTVLTLVSEPVRETLLLGQVNLILALVVAAECLLARPPWPRGILLGVAVAIKLTPGVFVLYFLLTRRWSAVAASVGSFSVCTVAAAALRPAASWTYWSDVFFRVGRALPAHYGANQSLLAVLSRWQLPAALETALWLTAAVAVVLLALWLARVAVLAQRPVEALLAIAVAGLLAAPVSWSHHWVLVVAVLVCLGWVHLPEITARVPVRGLGALVLLGVLLVGPYRLVPWGDGRELDWSAAQQLAGASLVLVGIAVLAAGAYRAMRRRPVSATVSAAVQRPPYVGLHLDRGHEE